LVGQKRPTELTSECTISLKERKRGGSLHFFIHSSIRPFVRSFISNIRYFSSFQRWLAEEGGSAANTCKVWELMPKESQLSTKNEFKQKERAAKVKDGVTVLVLVSHTLSSFSPSTLFHMPLLSFLLPTTPQGGRHRNSQTNAPLPYRSAATATAAVSSCRPRTRTGATSPLLSLVIGIVVVFFVVAVDAIAVLVIFVVLQRR
jgi:hypothetical protein